MLEFQAWLYLKLVFHIQKDEHLQQSKMIQLLEQQSYHRKRSLHFLIHL
jgi:hypothetical protein